MSELQKLVIPLLADVSKLIKGLEEAQEKTKKTTESIEDKFNNVSKTMLKVGGAMSLGVTGPIVAGFEKSLEATANWGEKLDSVNDALGTTSKEAAGLVLATERVGGSTEQLTGAFNIMTRGLLDATGQGLGPTGQALERLGINALDSNGKLRNSVELFQEVSDKLGPMEDGLSKSSLMMDIFGKSGVAMGDLLGASANGGLDSFNKQAEKLGLAFSDEQTQKVIKFKQSQEQLNQTFEAAKVSIGSIIMPEVEKLLGTTTFLLEKFTALPDGVKTTIISLLGLAAVVGPTVTGIGGLIGAGTKIAALFGAGGGIATGFAWFTGTALPAIGLGISAVGLPVIALGASFIGLGVVISVFGKDAWNTLTMISELMKLSFGEMIRQNVQTLVTIFNSVTNAIKTAVEWVNNFANSLSQIKIPSFLEMHSPPKLAIAVDYVSDSMKNLSQNVAPQFTSSLAMSGMVVNNQTQTTARVDKEDIRSIGKEFKQEQLDSKAFARDLANAILMAMGGG